MTTEFVPTSVPTTADRRDHHQQSKLRRDLTTMSMVSERELIRLRRTPTRIVSGLAQPILFLVVLGAGLSSAISGGATGGSDYQEFLLPGVLAMSVMISAIMAAISIVWDREFGFLREMLVAPVSRRSIVLGKALGGGTVAVAQGLVIIVLAPVVGLDLTVGRFFGAVFFLLLLAFSMCAFGIVLSSRVQRMESFQMIMMMVMQPMIFLSGAIFPLAGLPGWLTVITRLNPATYAVDPVRRVMIPSAPGVTLFGVELSIWTEALITIVFGTAMLAAAVRMFRTNE
jgi:ABC-2 type transport system permease protein